MAAAANPVIEKSKMRSIKTLVAESSSSPTLPLNYIQPNNHNSSIIINTELEKSIPAIDFSLLTSTDPTQRSMAIHHLAKACQDWGFFLVINHGVSESLMKEVMDGCYEFFNLTDEEKKEFEGSDVLDPIRCGTSFNTAKENNVFFWRDFLKVLVLLPQFHFPHKPKGFRAMEAPSPKFTTATSQAHPSFNSWFRPWYEIAMEFTKRMREVARELLRAISMSLGLEASYIHDYLNMESSLQVFIANLYPPCPQPELALGLPPHSDHGLLTLLMENGVGGLQVQHNGQWVNVNAPPYSFLVNTCDHLEILSNGKYKSVVHRAIVNNMTTRISVGIANGPSPDTIVSPAPELIDDVKSPAAYIPMEYKKYMQLQQENKLDQKSILDRIRLAKNGVTD